MTNTKLKAQYIKVFDSPLRYKASCMITKTNREATFRQELIDLEIPEFIIDMYDPTQYGLAVSVLNMIKTGNIGVAIGILHAPMNAGKTFNISLIWPYAIKLSDMNRFAFTSYVKPVVQQFARDLVSLSNLNILERTLVHLDIRADIWLEMDDFDAHVEAVCEHIGFSPSLTSTNAKYKKQNLEQKIKAEKIQKFNDYIDKKYNRIDIRNMSDLDTPGGRGYSDYMKNIDNNSLDTIIMAVGSAQSFLETSHKKKRIMDDLVDTNQCCMLCDEVDRAVALAKPDTKHKQENFPYVKNKGHINNCFNATFHTALSSLNCLVTGMTGTPSLSHREDTDNFNFISGNVAIEDVVNKSKKFNILMVDDPDTRIDMMVDDIIRQNAIFNQIGRKAVGLVLLPNERNSDDVSENVKLMMRINTKLALADKNNNSTDTQYVGACYEKATYCSMDMSDMLSSAQNPNTNMQIMFAKQGFAAGTNIANLLFVCAYKDSVNQYGVYGGTIQTWIRGGRFWSITDPSIKTWEAIDSMGGEIDISANTARLYIPSSDAAEKTAIEMLTTYATGKLEKFDVN